MEIVVKEVKKKEKLGGDREMEWKREPFAKIAMIGKSGKFSFIVYLDILAL